MITTFSGYIPPQTTSPVSEQKQAVQILQGISAKDKTAILADIATKGLTDKAAKSMATDGFASVSRSSSPGNAGAAQFMAGISSLPAEQKIALLGDEIQKMRLELTALNDKIAKLQNQPTDQGSEDGEWEGKNFGKRTSGQRNILSQLIDLQAEVRDKLTTLEAHHAVMQREALTQQGKHSVDAAKQRSAAAIANAGVAIATSVGSTVNLGIKTRGSIKATTQLDKQIKYADQKLTGIDVSKSSTTGSSSQDRIAKDIVSKTPVTELKSRKAEWQSKKTAVNNEMNLDSSKAQAITAAGNVGGKAIEAFMQVEAQVKDNESKVAEHAKSVSENMKASARDDKRAATDKENEIQQKLMDAQRFSVETMKLRRG